MMALSLQWSKQHDSIRWENALNFFEYNKFQKFLPLRRMRHHLPMACIIIYRRKVNDHQMAKKTKSYQSRWSICSLMSKWQYNIEVQKSEQGNN